jgi:lysozyme
MSNLPVPPSRPAITREEAIQYFTAMDFDKYPLYRLSIRGYYKKSMGDATKNDFGIYDDAICLITKNGFWTFNSNTDPSKTLRGSGVRKGTAIQAPGLYYSQSLDLHKGSYPALCQRLANVDVYRYKADGSRWTDTGMFGANCHSGGIKSTNSEGCETVYPMQYGEFIYLVIQAVGRFGWNGKCVPYRLIEY